MHYYSIHLIHLISSHICLFYCFMPIWVIFWVTFVAMTAILKMPPLCQKSRLARKNLFLYFSHHILPPYQKEKKSVRCHFLGLVRSLRKLVLSLLPNTESFQFFKCKQTRRPSKYFALSLQ